MLCLSIVLKEQNKKRIFLSAKTRMIDVSLSLKYAGRFDYVVVLSFHIADNLI